jgi:uncharacterized membrane protein YphA (DoxX/SURF4 family)
MAKDQPGFLSKQWKEDRLFSLCARMILGALFIYASIDKVLNPEAFAKAVYNYQILPDFLINLTAIILPWLELILGLSLIIGLFREGTVSIVTFLLVVFFGVMVFNLARGLDIHCGCFHTSKDGTSSAPMGWYVLRDGLFLLPAFYLFCRTFRQKRQPVRI